jgi:FMN phosphatase YigB (HAD superfamily)
MIYIFDLDYTLFDTANFNRSIPKALGIQDDIYNQVYQEYFKNKQVNFNVYKLISLILKKQINAGGDKEKMRKNIRNLLKEANKYLFPESENILKQLRKNKHKLILLSFGDLVWQKEKIKNLSIRRFFDRIFITDKIKSKALDFLKNSSTPIFIVNDNARECLEIKRVMPRAEIILIQGPYSYNIKHNFKVHRLANIFNYLI